MVDSVNGQWTSLQDEFLAKLGSEWTRHVACQRACHTEKACVCTRRIVLVDKLEAWMMEPAPEDSRNTKAAQLLYEMYDKMKTHSAFQFPTSANSLFSGDTRCLRLFAMLLGQGRGHLIDLFRQAKIYDIDLNLREYHVREGHPKLREKLREKGISETDIDEIIRTYEEQKWSYCPPLRDFTLHMEADFEGTKIILPFCKRIPVNGKGGTASVYWVLIQEDLLADGKLRDALEKSRYHDEDFGWCYQMALKCYSGNKKDSYFSEKEVFTGFRDDPQSMPVVRYLGCYTHDHGEGDRLGTTYNLLLEFGENDLMEYWADLTNVPPVRTVEISRFWKSLFNVAEAIRRMHNFQIPHGRGTLRYRGWHADIKPDNILRVRSEFKLADFGYSRFAPTDENTGTATEYITGGTDTYAAPELTRQRIFGTHTNVSQSIDTWSFGCVLSVAATWVVLGYQGILQYRTLREQALSNSTSEGHPTDRFHDCRHVLPEIRRWHGFLRGHLRVSDTTTEAVLDLIDTHMLQHDIRDRYEFDKLCTKLTEIIHTAEQKMTSLPQHARDIDENVVRALLEMENKAQLSRTSGPNKTALSPYAQPGCATISVAATKMYRVPSNAAQRASMRYEKDDILFNIPLGQTSYRKEILEEELKKKSLIPHEPMFSVGNSGNDVFTESPKGSTSIQTPPLSAFAKTRPPNPGLVMKSDKRILSIPNERSAPTIRHPTPPSSISHGSRTASFGETGGFNNGISTRVVNNKGHFTFEASTIDFTQRPTPYYMHQSAELSPRFEYSNVPETPERNSAYRLPSSLEPLSPPFSMEGGSPVNKTEFQHATISPLAGSSITPRSEVWGDSCELPSSSSSSNPNAAVMTRDMARAFNGYGKTSNDNVHKSEDTSHQTSGLNITIEPYEGGTFNSNLSDKGKQAIDQHNPPDLAHSQSDPSKVVLPIPTNALELPWDVCSVRAALDTRKPRSSLSWLKDKAGMEGEEKDAHLATFIHSRELIFVVDNGTTMVEHWPILKFVAETLSKKVAGLDRNGIDLRFTIKGHEFDKTNLKGDSGRRDFAKAIDKARPWPASSKDHFVATNMDQILQSIFKEWRTSSRKATTLIVLTDGSWEGTIPRDAINKTILDFAKEHLHKKHKSRHFSMGFIRFGETEVKRLRSLDDDLCTHNGLDDIIDHCSWRESVNKMILGSLDPYQDENHNSEGSFVYDQDELNRLFELYNTKASSLQASSLEPSQVSSRASSFDLHRRNTSRSNNGPTSPVDGEKRKKRLSIFSTSKD